MLRVDGLRGPSGAHKAPHLEQHLAQLRCDARAPSVERWVMVGDSVDDAHAAQAQGIACVLYDGGAHERTQLEDCGVQVADSLVEALRLADIGLEAIDR